jgi:hypothetical protein
MPEKVAFFDSDDLPSVALSARVCLSAAPFSFAASFPLRFCRRRMAVISP